jgi:Subtilisin inhibitor-like
MRKTLIPALLVLLAAAGLAACSPGGGSQGASPTSSGQASASPSATTPAAGTPSAGTETTVPAPSPSAAAPTAGPGQGNAELAIMVKPSETGQAVNYTLVCQNGVPAAESQHPTAAAACTALKENAALLSPAPRPKDTVCTQQYGGPEEAAVSGSVDGKAVEAKFSLRDGCEIAQWKAAKDVLGSTGGAV